LSTSAGLRAGFAVCAAAAVVAAGALSWDARAETPPPPAPESAFASQFADPAASFRPKYRWEQPLAATSDRQLRKELRQIAENGGGGAEVIGIGIPRALILGEEPEWGPGNSRLQTIGWGSPAWAHKTEVMTDAARDNGIALDMTLGPLWPASTPELDEINDPRAMQQLVFAQQFLAAGKRRSGPLPSNNSPNLPVVRRSLCGDPAKGAANLPIANDVGGFGVGDEIKVGAGARAERVRIVAKGSPGACTALRAPARAGARKVATELVGSFVRGEKVTIGAGAKRETVKIVWRSVEEQGRGWLTVSPPLRHPHGEGARVFARRGSGLTVSPPLKRAHSFGDPVEDTARGTIVAVLAARCQQADCAEQKSGSRMLDRSSVRDLTAEVSPQGTLEWTAPNDGGMWNVIVFRQTAANDTGSLTSLNNTTSSGTIYAEDYLSKAGARVSTEYWDAHVFTPATEAALRAIGGGDIFEDSLELSNNLKWTPDMVAEWERRLGYDPTTSLPALAGAGRYADGTQTPFYNFPGLGAKIRNDYKQMWSDLYTDNHIVPLREWANGRGLDVRMQPYGDPVDSAAAAAELDVPEGESFGFSLGGDPVETYKTVTSGAHFSGRKVTSTEMGAILRSNWNSIARGAGGTSNLLNVYQAFAGGVTSIVWFEFPYLQSPPNTGTASVWPGFSYGGNGSFAESWGPRVPQWEDYRSVNDSIARLSLILREGRPRFDLGVYRERFNISDGLLESGDALHQSGFTNDYVSPAFLRDGSASYEGGQLFPSQWGFRAFLLDEQTTMPVDVAEKLVALARQGLPVVVVGEPPSAAPGAKDPAGEAAAVKAEMAELMGLPSVRRVKDVAAAPGALAALGVAPAAKPAKRVGQPILSVRRQTADVDYYFLYNQSKQEMRQALTFTGKGRPYRIDTWTGEVTPLARFTSGSSWATTSVRVGANGATVIAVTDNPAALGLGAPNSLYATKTTADAALYDAAGKLMVRASAPGTYTTQLSDGRSAKTAIKRVAGAQKLGRWKLSVDGWSQPASNRAGQYKHTAFGPLRVRATAGGALPPWSEITKENGYPVDLEDVSGIGTYTTHVKLPRGVPGAYLDLGKATDTVRLEVNGKLVPLDQSNIRRIDLGGYLRAGSNKVVVRVASTLINAVRLSSTAGAETRGRNPNYGLVGPVVLRSYGQAEI